MNEGEISMVLGSSSIFMTGLLWNGELSGLSTKEELAIGHEAIFQVGLKKIES
jgi:hypothetical protein